MLNRIVSLTLSAALAANAMIGATPALAQDQTVPPQEGQEYPWTLLRVPGYGVTELTPEEEKAVDEREMNISLQKGDLYGAEYTFKPVGNGVATKETLPRFFEWNPGDGKQSSVHFLNDEETLNKAHVALGDRTAKRNILGNGEFIIVNEDSWADGVAAQAFSRNVNGAPILTTTGDALSDDVRAFLNHQIDEHNGHAPYVTLVGGEKVLGQEIVNEIHSMGGKVNRLAGESRIETMIEVARATKQHRADLKKYSKGVFIPQVEKFKITRGYAEEGDTNISAAYADMINAAKSFGNFPLLSTTNELHPAVADFIKHETRISTDHGCHNAEFTLVGGERALSAQVERDIEGLKNCEDQSFVIRRVAGETRYHTNVVDIARSLNHSDETLSGSDVLYIVDGQHSDMWRTAITVQQANLPLGDVIYAQGDDIPVISQRLVRSFGRSYRLHNYNTRSVFCYASEAACAKVRDLLDKGPNGGNWEVKDDPARPLSKFVK